MGWSRRPATIPCGLSCSACTESGPPAVGPGWTGAAKTRARLERQPGLGIVVLARHAADVSLLAALRAGARGYLVNAADTAGVVGAVLAVAAGTPSTAPRSPPGSPSCPPPGGAKRSPS
jgi:DNA-binding NarL/FixJ family response regulator